MESISLSPSKLSVFRECPRCAWDAYVAGVPRPRGIFPSLPGGMDRILKTYFDIHRGDLPPILKGKVPGALMNDRGRLDRWRNWRTGLTWEDEALGVQLIGALDDCLIIPGQHNQFPEEDKVDIYIPFDYKTRGSAPKHDGSSAKYYGTQIDCYELLLEHEGFKTEGKGILCYFWPKLAADEVNFIDHKMEDGELVTIFNTEIVVLESSAERAKETIKRAVEIMRGPRPDPAPDCEYCAWAEARNGIK